jgi:hypothetical protein
MAGRWLPGARQVAELKRFLAEVDATVPAGEAVAFAAQTDESQRLYVYLWAAFLLQGREVVPLTYSDWPRHASYVAIFGEGGDEGELELVERFEQGELLRIRP